MLEGTALMLARLGMTLDREKGICRLNNADREEWIDNDETLYQSWKFSRLSKRAFIKEDKQAIDDHICARLGVPREGGWTTAILGGPMKTSTKLWLLTGGVAAAVGGLAIAVGRKLAADAPLTPTLKPPVTATPLNETEITVFGQGLVRLAMHKKPLDPATMDRLVALAQKARLPKTAAKLMAIKAEGTVGAGGPTPTDELFPGSTMNIAEWISHRIKQLQAGVA